MGRSKDLPGPEILLSDRRYWKKDIFLRFVENCNEATFLEPKRGLELAVHAPALAKKIAPSTSNPDALFVAAYCVLGTAHRTLGNREEAERLYGEAQEHGATLHPLETVDLTRRVACLKLAQGQLDDALALIDDAILTYRTYGELSKRDFLGRCYVVRGEIYWHRGDTPQSLVDFSTALTHLDLKQSVRYVHATLHNLMVALSACSSPDALGEALRLLKDAERRTFYKRHRVAKYKLKWSRALISLRFGATRQATRFLMTARDGLVKLGLVHDVILISLDINRAYFVEARPAWEVLAFVDETYQMCSSMSADEEALAALLRWREFAEQQVVTDTVLEEIRERVLRMKPARLPVKE